MSKKEKTSIERLFEFDPISREDLEMISNSMSELSKIIALQQKALTEYKSSIDILSKKIEGCEQSNYSLSRKIDELVQQTVGINNMINATPQHPSFPHQTQSAYRQPIIAQPQPYGMQSQAQRDSTLKFDPMGVSAPIPGGSVNPMTPQQQALINQKQR
jgi:hypothetical protein